MYLAADQIPRPPVQRPPGFRLSQTLLEQGSGATNDDALAFNNNNGTFVVCDGATSLTGGTGLNRSGGQQAAEITASIFTEDVDDGPDIELAERAHRANAEIRRAMLRHGIDLGRREELWSTSFAAVQLKGDEIYWCQSGDCLILLLNLDGSSTLLTPSSGHDAGVLNRWKRIGASRKGSIHDELSEEIAGVRMMTNRHFGSLNGEPEALDFIRGGRLDGHLVSDILLFSDGFFPPSRIPEDPFDTKTFVHHYRSSGLSGLRDYIRAVQKHDSRCYRYPRFKMYDDMSGIALARS